MPDGIGYSSEIEPSFGGISSSQTRLWITHYTVYIWLEFGAILFDRRDVTAYSRYQTSECINLASGLGDGVGGSLSISPTEFVDLSTTRWIYTVVLTKICP